MDFLDVDGHDVPATFEAWRALRTDANNAPYDAVMAAFTDDLFVDVTSSKVVATCPGALSLRTVGDVVQAPVHEVEYLYARYGAPTARVKSLAFGEHAISLSSLSLRRSPKGQH